MRSVDAIVIGVGGMGSAACYYLAERGASVVGIEQFDVAHDRGSSHGGTRIIRKAYFEHPDYVPLLHRAYEQWDALEAASGRSLFERCGLLLAGPARGELIAGCRRAAAEHSLALDDISARDLPARFRGFRAREDMEILFEAEAGFLRVEDCVRTFVEHAARAGAEFRWNTAVRGWSADAKGVVVRTDNDEFSAGRLVICGGAWAGWVLRGLKLPLEVRRKVVLWYRTAEPAHRLDLGCPVFGFDTPMGFIYGFPANEEGELKIGNHTGGEVVADPDGPDRALHAADTEFASSFFSRHMPGVRCEVLRHAVCMYTMTPDEHFIIDRVPGQPQVSFAAGFSGHGFKFAPLVGSVLADLALEGKTSAPIEFLAGSRQAIARER